MHPLLNPRIDGEPARFNFMERALFDVLKSANGKIVSLTKISLELHDGKSRCKHAIPTQISKLRSKLVNHKITKVSDAGYIMGVKNAAE